MTSPLGIPCADGTPDAPLLDSQSRLITLFDRTPDAAITDRRLRHCDRTVLSSLGHFSMNSHPRVDATQREVAAHSCMTVKWLRNCYLRLEATGYIARERNHRTHAPARITLLYDYPGMQPGPAATRAPNRNSGSAPAQEVPVAPNRNSGSVPIQMASAPNGNATPPKSAPNGNATPPKSPSPSLYKDLDKNKGREKSPPPLNFSNLPRELQPPPRVMRQIARIAQDEAYCARLKAGLEAPIDDPY
jgi:hypothetical protein